MVLEKLITHINSESNNILGFGSQLWFFFITQDLRFACRVIEQMVFYVIKFKTELTYLDI